MNLARFERLMRSAVRELQLELAGTSVLTASGTNAFLATPLLAALGGATTYTLCADSPYGTAREVAASTETWAKRLGVEVRILFDRSELPENIDIVTNLGHVRPIDAALVSRLSPRGVVSYMCEAWEWREGDVDRDACEARGVLVAGHSEDFAGHDVFETCGQLLLFMCFEAGLSVRRDRIAVLGNDRFALVLARALHHNGAQVVRVTSPAGLDEQLVRSLDGLVVADYTHLGTLLGGPEGPRPAEIGAWNPALVVIPFAGRSDAQALRAAGVQLTPDVELPPVRMAKTLAHLGLRPTVQLLAQGLKAGELLHRIRGGAVPDPVWRSFLQPIVGTLPW